MSNAEKEPACTKMNYVVRRDELPLSCPAADMVIWNAHPRVYLPIEKTGVEICPYCDAKYILQDD